MTNLPHLTVAPVGVWDRLAIVALGSAGCALSYDALQQMAVAIHIRGFLTYLFPLVVDGFIAYGVRALLVLSAAPLRARLYVWLLFGTATSASIWANALHAVRLNQQSVPVGGLRLGDTVVAVLSTLAPLALAGAVHLYILITRHHPADQARSGPPAADQTGPASPEGPASNRPAKSTAGPDHGTDQIIAGGLADPESDRSTNPHGPAADQAFPSPATHSGPAPADRRSAPEQTGRTSLGPDATRPGIPADHATSPSADQTGGPDGEPAPTGPADHGADTTRPADRTTRPNTARPSMDQTGGPSTTSPSADRTGEDTTSGPSADQNGGPGGEPVPLEVLIPVAREAALAEGRMTRQVIRPYLREQNLTLSNERFTALQEALYRDPALAHLPRPRGRTT